MGVHALIRIVLISVLTELLVLCVARGEPSGVPAEPGPVPEHETRHPAEPLPAAHFTATAGPREPPAPTGKPARTLYGSHLYLPNSMSTFRADAFIQRDFSILRTPGNLYLCSSQQISQHQELFIQMLNEPQGEGGEGPEVGELGAAGEEGAPVNYIQVTPQEKEAIERVSPGPLSAGH